MEQIDIDINVNTNNVDEIDEITNRLEAATSEVERLEKELDNAHLNGDDIEADIIADELSDATAEAESLQEQLDGMSNTVITPEIDIDSTGIDEANEKLQETESTSSSLTLALGGLAGAIGVEQMISTADNIEMSWNRLELTFGKVSDNLKNSINSAATATGRSGGQVRNYFNQMGIAGIKNGELLKSSFESVAATSVQVDKPLETVENSLQKMVMTGNSSGKMLQNLGLQSKDLASALGVTEEEAGDAFKALDSQGRLEVLTKAMGDGRKANEMYKNSYEGLKTQASNAMAGLMGAVGQGTLPVITPMIQNATGLIKNFTAGFKGLPGPVKSVVGSFAGFLAVGATAVGTLGLLGKAGSSVVGGLKSIKSGYDSVKSAIGTAKTAMDALRASESITQGVRAALSVVTGAEATAEGAAAAAKTAATGPTLSLATAEQILLSPFTLVALAIIVLIAALWYLYNTNESVRNGVNWLTNQIKGFIASLIPAAQGVINFVMKVVGYYIQLYTRIANILTKVITFVGQWGSNLVNRGVSAARNFVNGVRTGLSIIGSVISSALSGVYNAITRPFTRAWNYVNNNVIKPLQNAWNSVSGMFSGYNGFEGYSGIGETLNGDVSDISSNMNNNLTVNNNFNGLIEESMAEYIINTVNDRLRLEKLLKGA